MPFGVGGGTLVVGVGAGFASTLLGPEAIGLLGSGSRVVRFSRVRGRGSWVGLVVLMDTGRGLV